MFFRCNATGIDRLQQGHAFRKALVLLCAAFLLGVSSSGCASLSNPVANGIPVRLLPPELLGESQEGLEDLPLSLLRRQPPKDYLVDAGDVLGVWIEGVLGEKGQAPPIHFAETGKQEAALGYPIPVRNNGTIDLPFIAPVLVKGMTLEQVQDRMVRAYTVDKQIIQPGAERIIVTLSRPRQYPVLVIRQDSTNQQQNNQSLAARGGRQTGFILTTGSNASVPAGGGTGFAIDLPAYENDVLNALTRTGGFPGPSAVNEIIIERAAFSGEQGRDEFLKGLQAAAPGQGMNLSVEGKGKRTIRIPLRYRPGQLPNITQEDITLQPGDIVFVAARQGAVFYTGGILPPGQYPLSRNEDLDILQAISLVGGPLVSGGITGGNINGNSFVTGIGAPSPSLVSVIRRTPNHGQLAIRVDLNKALRDPSERLIIQPQDLIILQERPDEAMTRYFTDTFNFNLVYQAISSSRAKGTATLKVP